MVNAHLCAFPLSCAQRTKPRACSSGTAPAQRQTLTFGTMSCSLVNWKQDSSRCCRRSSSSGCNVKRRCIFCFPAVFSAFIRCRATSSVCRACSLQCGDIASRRDNEQECLCRRVVAAELLLHFVLQLLSLNVCLLPGKF